MCPGLKKLYSGLNTSTNSKASCSTGSNGNGRRDNEIVLVTVSVPVLLLEGVVHMKVVVQVSYVQMTQHSGGDENLKKKHNYKLIHISKVHKIKSARKITVLCLRL